MLAEPPDGWRPVQLGDIARIVTGKTPSTKQGEYWGGDIPFVTPSDISDSPWLRQVERTLSADGAKSSSVVPAGTVLFTCIASIGKSCITKQASALNQQINACVPGPEVDSYFLYTALQARVQDIIDLAGTTAVPIINKSTFSKISLDIPPLDEQRRIAEVLCSVDEAIVNYEQVVTQARSTLSASLAYYFCSSGAETSNSNFTPLSDLVSLQSGFAFKSEEYQNDGHFLIRIGNVQDGQIELNNPKFVKIDERTQPFELARGDILTSLTGNIGRVARISAAHLPAALNQRVARIAPNIRAPIQADYLYFALQSPLFKDSLVKESGGAAQQNVSPKAIGRVNIPLPSLVEQQRISELLLSAESVVSQGEYSLAQLNQLKVNLMSDLLSGHVRVPA